MPSLAVTRPGEPSPLDKPTRTEIGIEATLPRRQAKTTLRGLWLLDQPCPTVPGLAWRRAEPTREPVHASAGLCDQPRQDWAVVPTSTCLLDLRRSRSRAAGAPSRATSSTKPDRYPATPFIATSHGDTWQLSSTSRDYSWLLRSTSLFWTAPRTLTSQVATIPCLPCRQVDTRLHQTGHHDRVNLTSRILESRATSRA